MANISVPAIGDDPQRSEIAIRQIAGVLTLIGNGPFTVATLPAGKIDQRAYVTDALAPTFLAPVVGGGGVTCPVWFNGSVWLVA